MINLEEAFIFYQPRIRLWQDKKGKFHIGGEPDGFMPLLQIIRTFERAMRERGTIKLVDTAIPKGRNPVASDGVRQNYSALSLQLVYSKTGTTVQIAGDVLKLRISREEIPRFYMSVCEAIDGAGDFSISCQLMPGKVATRLWFWGFSNIHGCNGF